MDKLAEGRAHSCRAALVANGVPASATQLFVTSKGRGGQLKVDFIPCGPTNHTSTGNSAARGPCA